MALYLVYTMLIKIISPNEATSISEPETKLLSLQVYIGTDQYILGIEFRFISKKNVWSRIRSGINSVD